MEPEITCSSLLLDSGGGWLDDITDTDSFMLFKRPVLSMSFQGELTRINTGNKIIQSKRDPVMVLEGYLSEGYVAAGYLGYEYSGLTDTGFTPVRRKDGTKFPELFFHLYRMEDIERGSIRELAYRFNLPVNEENPCGIDKGNHSIISNMSKAEYIDMVLKAKKYIEYGDLYQINLSQRFMLDFTINPLPYFMRMFHVQHVPFASYMDFGDFQLLSGSMELFLRKKGRKLLTKPIKGTRRRGLSEQADTIKKAELVSSEKERAENLMIVDLMRNDLSRVCRPGSVKVNGLFEIESYATLHQMVSEVQGEIKADAGIGEIVRNVFPPGSVTGAPKKRTLEIIDELEPHYRGPYCGAIGVFYPDGDFTLSVGIRVLAAEAGRCSFWAGGGIVWDSDPEKEYEESLLKSLAVRKAFGLIE
ncbi:MAG: aminodeoxychorismate synthase component I [Deltaproteobacteria bacterium]